MPDSYLCTYATAKYPRVFVCFQRRIEPLSSLPPGVVPYQQLVMRPNGGVRPYDAQDGECECECERNVHNDAYEEDEQQCGAGLGVVLQEREQRLQAGEAEVEECLTGQQRTSTECAALRQRLQACQARAEAAEAEQQRTSTECAALRERLHESAARARAAETQLQEASTQREETRKSLEACRARCNESEQTAERFRMQLLEARHKNMMFPVYGSEGKKLSQELNETKAEAQMFKSEIARMTPQYELANSMLEQIKTLQKQNLTLTQALEKYQGADENTDALRAATW